MHYVLVCVVCCLPVVSLCVCVVCSVGVCVRCLVFIGVCVVCSITLCMCEHVSLSSLSVNVVDAFCTILLVCVFVAGGAVDCL